MKPGTGTIISISMTPSGNLLQERVPQTPFLIRVGLNIVHFLNQWRTSRYGVTYDYVFMTPGAEDLQRLAVWVEEGKIKPVVGRIVSFDDIESVRDACNEVYEGKGSIGKMVIEIVPERS